MLQALARISLTKRNVIGNLLAKLLVAGLSFVFVPIYLHLLGAEGFGLIGLYVSLQAIVSLLDMGLSPTLMRELARLSASPGAENDQEARDLVRTLEVIYWLIGVGICIGVVALAPWITHRFVHPVNLPPGAVVQTIAIIGLIMLFQWPDSFYSGGLLGLQKQMTLNLIRVGTALLQGFGALFILRYVSNTIQAYFGWLVVVWFLQTVALVICLWRALPRSAKPPRYRNELWRKVAGYTTGLTGIAITAIILTQLDKMVLMANLSLAAFGFYMLASNTSNTITFVVNPIFSAVFPRYTQMATVEDEAGLSQFYHRTCQFLSLILMPLTVMGVLFSHELLMLYLHDTAAVASIQLLFCLMLIGTALNCAVTLPYGLQLAYGWTRLSLYKNILAVALFVPSLLFAVRHFGTVGAASMWIALNAGYFLFEIPVMHRRLLRREMGGWYLRDIALPLLLSLLIGGVARMTTPVSLERFEMRFGMLLWVGFASGLAILGIALSMPWLRRTLNPRRNATVTVNAGDMS